MRYWTIKVDTPSGVTLDGFAKTGEWRRGDQAPFERVPRLTGALGRLGVVRYHATGLFAFAVDEARTPDVSEAAMTSALAAVRSIIPSGEELRAAVDLADTRLNQAFDQLGAPPSTRTAQIALGRYERDYGLRTLPPTDVS